VSGTPPEGRRAVLRIAYLGDPNSVHTRRWISFFADRGHAVFLLDGFGAQFQPGLDPREAVLRYRAFGKLPVRLLVCIGDGCGNLFFLTLGTYPLRGVALEPSAQVREQPQLEALEIEVENARPVESRSDARRGHEQYEQLLAITSNDLEEVQVTGVDLTADLTNEVSRFSLGSVLVDGVAPSSDPIEVAEGTPYIAIGEHGYGKPLLDRALEFGTAMEDALKIAYLAFDAVRTSSTDVDFPLDVVVCPRDSYRIIEHRYEREDLLHVSEWWQARVRLAMDEAPAKWVNEVFSKLGPRLLDPDRDAEAQEG
jgi:hypothetical protein